MAKKKSKSEKAPKSQKRLPTKEGRNISKKKKDSMKEKVEIKKPNGTDKASRIVGTIFIGLGILLVAFGIYSFLKFRAEPTYNEDLPVPTMEYVTDLTNEEEILVRGNAQDFDSVAVFVNDERVDEARVKDDMYEFAYEVEDEGTYSISVAGLQGFPFREISPRSEAEIALVDKTGPDADTLSLQYVEETNQSTFTLKGNTEPNVGVEIRRGVSTYQATADEQGDFRIEGISLDEGKNVFYISLTDPAGNTVSLDERVRIAYSPDADLNGDGVTDTDGGDVAGTDDELPEAAGELDNLLARRLMLIFGIAALFVFSGSSIYAFNRKQ
jgi:hypothetical protein